MKALLFSLTAFLIVFAAGTGVANPQHAPSSAPDASSGKKAEEQFKNIQVLKGVPADQIVPGMQFIAASLGVDCTFCHLPDEFDKDDKKPKQAARKMMTMMFATNKDNFDGQRGVTCFSCHRGSPNPISIPPVMEDVPNGATATSKAEAEKASAEKPSADQLLDKYLKAVGGAAAVENINSRVMKGTITFGDRNVPIDIFAKDPEKRISFTHTPDGDSVTAFDGREGWLGYPGRPPRDMHGQELDAAAMDADLHFAAHLKGMFTEALVHNSEKIGDTDTYVVLGRRADKPPLRLYFDKNSGLLVRLVRYAQTPVGLLPTQIDYADYRETGGVRIPFRWTLARTSGRFTIQISEVKENVLVDDAKFIKPAAPPEEKTSSK